MEKITAVLLTVFNRKETTLLCLKSFHEQAVSLKMKFDIFLVDDGSTDGTFEAVSMQFPRVNLIKGTGDLFWGGGMRLAWNTAIKKKKYDFFLWLNDDTIILDNGLNNLFEDYKSVLKFKKEPFLITGACKKTNSNEFSYGGRNELGAIVPNGELQTCKYINGNIVLVPFEVYEIIGILSEKYTHAIGDFDYGLRALRNNINCYTTSSYVAMCDENPISGWMDSSVPFKKRRKLFFSPKGLNVKEFMYFTRKHYNFKRTISVFFKVHLQVFFPKMYHKLKNKL